MAFRRFDEKHGTEREEAAARTAVARKRSDDGVMVGWGRMSLDCSVITFINDDGTNIVLMYGPERPSVSSPAFVGLIRSYVTSSLIFTYRN